LHAQAYTLAFTCEAAMDNPDQVGSTVMLFSPIGIAVVAKQTTTAGPVTLSLKKLLSDQTQESAAGRT
jgi:hypothetical protein